MKMSGLICPVYQKKKTKNQAIFMQEKLKPVDLRISYDGQSKHLFVYLFFQVSSLLHVPFTHSI